MLRDVKSYLHVIGREKNLLLYYPAAFSISGEYDPEAAVDTIMNVVHSYYHRSLDYRREVTMTFETYIAFFFEGDLILLQYTADGMFLVDRVPAKVSRIFCEIAGYYEAEQYPVMKEFDV